MLTVENCRRLLGPSCRFSDSELEQLRNQLMLLAEISLSLLESGNVVPGLDIVSKSLPSRYGEELEERAAILEFEAGSSREDAESLAFTELRAVSKGAKDEPIN